MGAVNSSVANSHQWLNLLVFLVGCLVRALCNKTVDERKHQTIGKINKCLLNQSGVPSKYWAHAFATGVFVHNCLVFQTQKDDHRMNFYSIEHQTIPYFERLDVSASRSFPNLFDRNRNRLHDDVALSVMRLITKATYVYIWQISRSVFLAT